MLHVAWQLALYCPLLLLVSFLRLFSFFGYHQINILINSEGSLLSQLSLTWTQVHFGHTLQLQSALKSIQFEFKTHFIALHCSSNCLSNLSVWQSVSLAVCQSICILVRLLQLTSLSSNMGLSLESRLLSNFESAFIPPRIHSFFQSLSVSIDFWSVIKERSREQKRERE